MVYVGSGAVRRRGGQPHQGPGGRHHREKKQRLWDGNTDIIYADYSSCVEFTKEGVDAQLAMKLFDTCGNLEGSGVISMADDGITFNGEPFDFNKDFFMLFPKDMDEAF